MGEIAHPETGEQIEIEIIDRESHHGFESAQVRAVADGITLSDQSGDQPWVNMEEINE